MGYVGQVFTNPLPIALILIALHPQWWLVLLPTVLVRAIAAWAVSRATRQIYRLSVPLPAEPAVALAGEVEIEVIGDRSQWSNYLPHLKDLNPRIAKYLGGMRQSQLKEAYDNADALLLPSLYEPGGIVIGEALSHGSLLRRFVGGLHRGMRNSLGAVGF